MTTRVIRRIKEEREGLFDNTYPSEIQGKLTNEQWEAITQQIDELWSPIVLHENKADGCATCLCCCCCCTLGITCCILCCYMSVQGSPSKKRMVKVRAEIKEYFGDLNKQYADQGVQFVICPTVSDLYYEVKIAGSGGDDAASSRKDSGGASKSNGKAPADSDADVDADADKQSDSSSSESEKDKLTKNKQKADEDEDKKPEDEQPDVGGSDAGLEGLD